MSALDNLQTNHDKVVYSSTDAIDQVIFAGTFPYGVTNTVGSYTFTESTNTSQLALPVGIYSTDGGTTWNDLGAGIPTGSLNKGITKPPLFVQPNSLPDGSIQFNVTVNSTIGSGSTFALLISIAMLATDTPSTMPGIPELGGHKVAYSSLDTDTGAPTRYRQITIRGSQPVTSGSTLVSVPYSLGYVPDLFVWFNTGPGTAISILPPLTFLSSSTGTLVPFSEDYVLDSSNIYFAPIGLSASYIYRGYKP